MFKMNHDSIFNANYAYAAILVAMNPETAVKAVTEWNPAINRAKIRWWGKVALDLEKTRIAESKKLGADGKEGSKAVKQV